MTRRRLVPARATKPLHQTRSLHEVVVASGRARRHDPGVPLVALGCRMGRAATAAAAPHHAAGRPATQASAAPGHRRDPLPGRLGLRLAAAADFPPAADGVLVVCQVGRRRHPGTHPPGAARAGPHSGGPQPDTAGGDHRLPVDPRGRHRAQAQPRRRVALDQLLWTLDQHPTGGRILSSRWPAALARPPTAPAGTVAPGRWGCP
jgi:hypothetical protein